MRYLLSTSLCLILLCNTASADTLRSISQAGRLLQRLGTDAPYTTPDKSPAPTTGMNVTPTSTLATKSTATNKPYQPRIAIIIDDIGNNIPLGKRTAELPGNLTLAVLPKTPGAVLVAKQAHAAGKQIMLHAPMSNEKAMRLGPGGLTEDMEKMDFINTLNDDIDAIPHISGVNNHMGSLLTTHQKQMEWVMDTLKQRQLFFVDSLTSNKSVAYRTAKENGLEAQKRDVFLDHFRDEASIEKAYLSLIRKARLRGYAIGIGHPYPETLSVLERLLPQLQEQNIELVHVSELLQANKNQQLSSLSE